MTWLRLISLILVLCAIFFGIPAIIENSLSLGVTAEVCAFLAWVTWHDPERKNSND